MSMPDKIELPEAEDFCRGYLFGEKQCCFIGWRIKLLPDMDHREENNFEDTALKIAGQMKLKSVPFLGGIPSYNDCYANSGRRLSTWFRKTIEELGYDVK